MGLYLIVATRDLTTAVRAVCPAFYMPLRRCAFVSYEGRADELARRLGLGRSGGPGVLAVATGRRIAWVAASVLVVLLSFGVLT